jgi:photosystem II stability/assembly factor-like uncharacterized protein
MTSRQARLASVGLLLTAVWSLLLAPRALAYLQSGSMVTTLVLFAGTPAGLFASRDWGDVWQPVERPGAKGEDPRQIGAVHAILPLGPLVYVGGDNGLMVSADHGQTWQRREVPGPVLAILAPRYPEADPTLFVGTPGGLLRSHDGGVRFEPTALAGTPVTRIEWPGPALFAATGRGLRRSDDSGDTFEEVGSGLPAGAANAFALSSFFAVDPTLFVSVGSEGVFYSADGGRSWRVSGLAGQAVTDLIWLGRSLYAVGNAGLFRSEDAGRTWASFGAGLAGRRLNRMLFPTAPQSGAQALVTTDDGVYRSFDGGLSWQPVGLKGQAVHCVATFPPPEGPPLKRR